MKDFNELRKHLERLGCETKRTSNGLRYFWNGQLVTGHHLGHGGQDNTYKVRDAIRQGKKNGFGHFFS